MRPGGEPFERYTLLELLGRGAAAAVYRAYDPLGNREVALKLLTAKGERQLLRFQREARTMSQLRHPHLVPVFRGGLVGTQAYLAMELVEGPTLDSLSQPGRTLPTFEAVAYLRDVSLAIQYAHDMGVVHRDLKPSNVLIDSSRKARVVDFGIAHVQRESGAALTHSGTLLGTAAYMAPEQAAGQAADARSDVYGLGATLYHALTGHAPYEDQKTSPLVAVHRGQPTPIRKLCARPVPPRLVKAVRRAMSREPAARFPFAGAFATELEAILAAGYAPTAVGLRPWKLGVGALLALLVAGVLALVVAELGQRATKESRPLPAERLTTQLATLRVGVAEDASPAGLLRVLAEARGLVASEPALGAQLEATQLELAPRVLQQAQEAARRAEPFDAATAQRYALAVELATGEARWGAALARALLPPPRALDRGNRGAGGGRRERTAAVGAQGALPEHRRPRALGGQGGAQRRVRGAGQGGSDRGGRAHG